MHRVGVSMIHAHAKLKLIPAVRCEENSVGKLY